MRLILQVFGIVDSYLRDLPLAGRTPASRMLHALHRAGLDDVTLIGTDALPESITLSQPTLWIHGLFPFLPEEAVRAFLGFAKERGNAWWSATSGTHAGLLALAENVTLSRNDLPPRDTIQHASKWKGTGTGLEPLIHVSQLADMSARIYRRQARRVLGDGAILLAPDQTWIEDDVHLDAGVVVEPNVILSGNTRIGKGSLIQSGARLTNVSLGTGTTIKAYSVLEDCTVGDDAQVGPFAHVRPGSQLGNQVRVGNFVETKKVVMADRAKASHLAYLGDAHIGEDTNIGAGTITCNYDGYNKHHTHIGKRVFVGSDTQLVAPVTVGDGALLGAGSTITKDVPADALTLTRTKQVNLLGKARRLRERLAQQAAQDSDKHSDHT